MIRDNSFLLSLRQYFFLFLCGRSFAIQRPPLRSSSIERFASLNADRTSLRFFVFIVLMRCKDSQLKRNYPLLPKLFLSGFISETILRTSFLSTLEYNPNCRPGNVSSALFCILLLLSRAFSSFLSIFLFWLGYLLI